MLKALQKRMNRLALIGGVDVERAGEDRGLVGDDADRPAQDAAEADDDVRRVAGLDLQEVAAVDDPADHVAHVVALLGLDRARSCSARGWGRRCCRAARRGGSSRLFEGRKLSRRRQIWMASCVVLGDEVDHAGVRHVRVGAAQRLGGDLLAGHLLDDLRAR